MRVAIAQLEFPYFTRDKNEEKVINLVRKAIVEKVDLVLLPEGTNLGYFILDETKSKEEAQSLAMEMAHSFSSPWVKELRQEAKKGIYVACGSFIKMEKNGLSNSLLLFSPDGEIFVYHKTHLFHLREAREEDFVTRGHELVVISTDLAKIGLSICYDLNFPEVFRTLALKGAQIILLPAAWPKMAGATWDILLPARALENQVYVLACGQTGGEYYGHSKIIDYTGDILAEFEEEEGLRIAEIDIEREETWRKKVTLFDDRRPEIYKL